jgi:hypothetical protein
MVAEVRRYLGRGQRGRDEKRVADKVAFRNEATLHMLTVRAIVRLTLTGYRTRFAPISKAYSRQERQTANCRFD